MRQLLNLIAQASPETKGLLGMIAALSVEKWCAVAVAVCTCVYLIRKTLLLQPAPVLATDKD